MPNIVNLNPNVVGLVQQQEDGRIVQIGLTEEQSRLLQIFLAQISQGNPFVQMGEDWDFVLKSSLCKKCKSNCK